MYTCHPRLTYCFPYPLSLLLMRPDRSYTCHCLPRWRGFSRRVFVRLPRWLFSCCPNCSTHDEIYRTAQDPSGWRARRIVSASFEHARSFDRLFCRGVVVQYKKIGSDNTEKIFQYPQKNNLTYNILIIILPPLVRRETAVGLYSGSKKVIRTVAGDTEIVRSGMCAIVVSERAYQPSGVFQE